MIFADKIIVERKKLGLSQEQLADRLNVTRQSVSKWESGASVPELGKIVQLAEMFGVSVDYLVKDTLETDSLLRDRPAVSDGGQVSDSYMAASQIEMKQQVESLNRYLKGYSYTSKAKIGGIPLVSIRFSRYFGKNCVAKGIIAIGTVAVGVISIGAFSVGVISIGALAVGLLSLAAVAFGAAAFGAVAIGLLAVGCSAVGIYAAGLVAAGKELAVGMSATGDTALGSVINGTNLMEISRDVTHEITREGIQGFIQEHCPRLWKPVADLFTTIAYAMRDVHVNVR